MTVSVIEYPGLSFLPELYEQISSENIIYIYILSRTVILRCLLLG